MQQPPRISDPYQLIDPAAPNRGTTGVAMAWDGMRQFWGTVINQAWGDLQTTIDNGKWGP